MFWPFTRPSSRSASRKAPKYSAFALSLVSSSTPMRGTFAAGCAPAPSGAAHRSAAIMTTARNARRPLTAGSCETRWRSEHGERVRGRARGADQADRRGGEHELVAAFLGAGPGEPLGIRVVHQHEAEERDGQMRAHGEARIADRVLVHHVPGDGR